MGTGKVYRLIFILLHIFLFGQIYSQIKINEFASFNTSQLIDEDGEYSDWIEFINTSNEVVNLTNYTLTDDITDTSKWSFPSINIQPNHYQIIFASGKDRSNNIQSWHTVIDQGASFKYLIPENDIGDEWKNIGFDDDSWLEGYSGFGYGDDDDATLIDPTISLFVRKEFSVDNIDEIAQVILHMDYDDAFVAYINGVEIARENLGTPGESVAFNAAASGTDHEALIYQGIEPDKFEITDWNSILHQGINVLAVEVHNVSSSSSDLSCIPFLSIGLNYSGEYTASQYLNLSVAYPHSNFKIADDGEAFYVFNNKVLVDSVGATKLSSDISYGRQPDGGEEWFYFETPTPNAPNNEKGFLSQTSDSVLFSSTGGYFNSAIELALYLDEGIDGNIYYTTDGSEPNINSYLYNLPIEITTDTVIRARVISNENLPGPISTQTYINGLSHSFPIICLSTNPDNLWDNNTGIYVDGPNIEAAYPYYGANYWEDWEKPVHFEYYDKTNTKRIDQGAGIKIFGGYSRTHDQKSFALYARKEYGKGSFKYKFFDDKENDKYESVILRNSGTDFYKTHFRDGFISTAMSEIGLEHQGFQPTVVYINGNYWGILNLREKVNEHFISDNIGADKDSINILEMDGYAIRGKNDRYEELLNFIISNSLVSDENYNTVCEIIDIDNFIDYYLVETYIDNGDWPGNNIKYWNTNSSRSKFHWILFDTDYGFGLFYNDAFKYNSIADALAADHDGWPNPPWGTLLFRKLAENDNFKTRFVQRGCDYLNTYWQSSTITDLINSFENLYSEEMVNHCQRWNLDYNSWAPEVDVLREFAQERPYYYSTYLAEEMGFEEDYSVVLDVFPDNAGNIKINSVTPDNYVFIGQYYKNIPIEIKATPNPGYKFVGWEGDEESTDSKLSFSMQTDHIHTAIFEETFEDNTSIIINEVFYKSSDEYKPGDWIELYNDGETTVDLFGWTLSDTNIDSAFVIPTSFLLAPGEYIVFCKNKENFKTTYPWVNNLIGELSFGLSSSGDQIRLYDDNSQLIDAVDYYTNGSWPAEANGQGSSLELINPKFDNTKGGSWYASTNGGTPGYKNLTYIDSGIRDKKQDLAANLTCTPNPVSDYATVKFNINNVGTYQVDLINMNGTTIKRISDNFYTIGEYSIKLNESDLYLLKSGVYLIRLSGNNGIETIKMIKQ